VTLVSQQGDWTILLDGITARVPRLLQDVPPGVASAVLAGPCAIATWIAARDPAIAEKQSVSILLMGAESTDVPDEGRWYQMLPLLLGRSFSVQTACVGLELDMTFSSSARAHAPARAARGYRISLADFLLARGDEPIDLAFAFHPGLQKHRGWLGSDGFPKLLDRGTPVVCAAYEFDEYEMERWVTEAYGYEVDTTPVLNPYFLDVSGENTSIKWGRVLWRICKPPARGFQVDEFRLRALETLNDMVMHSMASSGSASPPYGSRVQLKGAGARPLDLIHVFDNRFVDPATGEVLLLEAHVLKTAKQLPRAALADYPGDNAREIERAIWAASLKARFLLDTYPPTRASHSTMAAGMFSKLRRRAASLFRG